MSTTQGWIKVVRASVLPLPSSVKRIRDVPGEYLDALPKKLEPDDYVLTATEKTLGSRTVPVYTLLRFNPGIIGCFERIPFGSIHKKLIKSSPGNEDLVPGAGPISAMIREIHAIQRGILTPKQVQVVPAKRVNRPHKRALTAPRVAEPTPSTQNLSPEEAQYRRHVRGQYLRGDNYSKKAGIT